jgi:hypothetical protein
MHCLPKVNKTSAQSELISGRLYECTISEISPHIYIKFVTWNLNHKLLRLCPLIHIDTKRHNSYITSSSFLVLLSSTYFFTVGIEGFCNFIWSHSNTHHSRQDSSGQGIGPSQRPLPDNTNTVQDKHPCPGGIRTHDPTKRSAADLRLRPRGHWDRPPTSHRTETKLYPLSRRKVRHVTKYTLCREADQ